MEKDTKEIQKGNKRNMSEIIVAEQNIGEFIRAYCYNKMCNWEALVDMYGAEYIMQKIEAQEVKLDTEEGKDHLGYIYLGEPAIYIFGTPEERYLENIQQDANVLEVILHEMLHKVWEEETHIACEQIGKNGEALGEGLTDWGVKKMQQGHLEENSYWKYTSILEVLERFLGEKQVLALSKNDRSALQQAVGNEKVDCFLTYLDTHLQMQRANEMQEALLDIVTELIALMESGLSLEDIRSFRKLQGELEQSEAYKVVKHLAEGETGTLEYYRKLHTIVVHMQAENEVEQKRCLRYSMGMIADHLLKPYVETLEHAKQRDLELFENLERSVAELMIASREEHCQTEEKLDASGLSKEKLLEDALGALQQQVEALKEKWKKEILEDIRKYARRPKKLQASIQEMSALLQHVTWNESDKDWYTQVAEAMGVEEEKREGMADILRIAEKEGNLAQYRTYSVEYFKNGDAVFKQEGKPCSFRKNGKETEKVKPIEEVESGIDFTVPFGKERQMYVKHWEEFKNLVLSREKDAHISTVNGMIVVEHADTSLEYYKWNEKAEIVCLAKDGNKPEVRGDGKKKKTTLKEKMHQWFQKRFTSKTSVRLLVEGRKQEMSPVPPATFEEERKAFVKKVSEKVEGMHHKQWEKQRKREMERAERKWLSGR